MWETKNTHKEKNQEQMDSRIESYEASCNEIMRTNISACVYCCQQHLFSLLVNRARKMPRSGFKKSVRPKFAEPAEWTDFNCFFHLTNRLLDTPKYI